MVEDTETQITEKIKKSKLFALQLDESTDIQNNSILLTYVRYIDHDESDMKEDLLSVSELSTHTTSSEMFKVLNSFIEEKVSNGKIALGFVLSIFEFRFPLLWATLGPHSLSLSFLNTLPAIGCLSTSLVYRWHVATLTKYPRKVESPRPPIAVPLH